MARSLCWIGAVTVACEVEGLTGGSRLPSTAWSLCWMGARMVALEIDGLTGGSSETFCSILSEGVGLLSEPEEDSMAFWNRRRLRLLVSVFEDMVSSVLGCFEMSWRREW
jgi:hypothetical protein